jgi:signal transduction histidine kinase
VLLQEALGKYSHLIERATSGSLTRIAIDQSRVMETDALVDRKQMFECFANLIHNAIKALPKEGGTIRLTLCPDPSQGVFEATIEDNGCGISDDDLKLISAGRPLRGRATRAGVGLFLARLYCQSHCGQLRIESCTTPGATGTRATMRIPLHHTDHEARFALVPELDTDRQVMTSAVSADRSGARS